MKTNYNLPEKYAQMTAQQVLETITAETAKAVADEAIEAAKYILDRDTNEPARLARYTEIFAHAEKAEKLRDYIAYPYYRKLSVKEGKDGYTITEGYAFIQFKALDTAYRKTDKKGYLYTKKDYLERLYACTKTMLAYKDSNNNDGKAVSVNACTKALIAFAESIIPEEMNLRELKGFDAKHFADAFIQVKNGKTTDKTENECMKEFVLGMYYVMNGERYPTERNEKTEKKHAQRLEAEAKKNAKKAAKKTEKK